MTRLAIIGHEEAAIGQTFSQEAVIPLRAEHAPNLRELELGYYFTQDDLLDFLVAHSSTLEVWESLSSQVAISFLFITVNSVSISLIPDNGIADFSSQHLVLNHCFISADINGDESSSQEDSEPVDEPERRWNTWFHRYASNEPRALQRTTFKPYNAPIIDPESMSDLDVITRTSLFLDERKAEERELRVFPYAEVDIKYGAINENKDFNRRKARKGRDLEGWYELMDVMESNRERLRGAEAANRQER